MFLKKKNKIYTSVIIAAAGSGSRMGAEVNKIFLELGNMPVLARTLLVFEKCDEIDEIIIVASEKELFLCSELAKEYKILKLKSVVCGGQTRQQSVKNGLAEVSGKAEIVLIHDAARPLVTEETVCAVKNRALSFGAAACGAKNKNTVKRIDDDGFIVETLNRDYLVEIQTPQGFKKEKITAAHERAEKNGFAATDDCMLLEAEGEKVKVVFSRSDNIKITTYDDLLLAEQILEKTEGA